MTDNLSILVAILPHLCATNLYSDLANLICCHPKLSYVSCPISFKYQEEILYLDGNSKCNLEVISKNVFLDYFRLTWQKGDLNKVEIILKININFQNLIWKDPRLLVILQKYEENYDQHAGIFYVYNLSVEDFCNGLIKMECSSLFISSLFGLIVSVPGNILDVLSGEKSLIKAPKYRDISDPRNQNLLIQILDRFLKVTKIPENQFFHGLFGEFHSSNRYDMKYINKSNLYLMNFLICVTKCCFFTGCDLILKYYMELNKECFKHIPVQLYLDEMLQVKDEFYEKMNSFALEHYHKFYLNSEGKSYSDKPEQNEIVLEEVIFPD